MQLVCPPHDPKIYDIRKYFIGFNFLSFVGVGILGSVKILVPYVNIFCRDQIRDQLRRHLQLPALLGDVLEVSDSSGNAGKTGSEKPPCLSGWATAFLNKLNKEHDISTERYLSFSRSWVMCKWALSFRLRFRQVVCFSIWKSLCLAWLWSASQGFLYLFSSLRQICEKRACIPCCCFEMSWWRSDSCCWVKIRVSRWPKPS